MIGQTILLAIAALLGAQWHNRQRSLSNRPLPMLVWDIVAQWSVAKQRQNERTTRRKKLSSQARSLPSSPENKQLLTADEGSTISESTKSRGDSLPTSFATSHSPYFGERPHYFTPPSDMEQYRLRSVTAASAQGSSSKMVGSRILSGDDRTMSYQHHYIPYPNDAPYTFPAIKARAIFTKKPKHVKQVYIASVDPVQRTNLRTGAKLEVPLTQLEERFRTVYSNAERNQLMITMNATKDHELRKWERDGLLKRVDDVYDFHHVDGLVSPPLTDTKPKTPVLEPSWFTK